MKGLCKTYEEWRHCITVKCGIPLSKDYIAKRINALSKTNEPMTARFIELYGEPHRLRTIEWFEQAGREAND